MRRLHGAGRRQGDALLRHADFDGREIRDHHARRARHARQAASAAARVHRRTGGAVRLLHQRHDHDGQGTARPQSAPERAATCARRSPPISAAAAPTIASSAPCCAPRRRTGGPDDERSPFRPAAVHGGPRRDRGRLLARSACAARPGGAAAARQPADQPQARWLDPHQCRRHRHGLHRQDRAGPGHPDRARPDRGRRTRPAARAHHDDLRRYRPDAERRPDRRQPVGREQRHGAAHGRRGGAGDPASISPPSGSARPPISSRSPTA